MTEPDRTSPTANTPGLVVAKGEASARPARRQHVRCLGPLLGAATAVMTVHNGIPWWYFQRHGGEFDGRALRTLDPDGVLVRAIAADRIIGCVAYPAASMVAPGVIEHVEGDRFPIGELDGRMGEQPNTVHLTGCPSINPLVEIDLALPRDLFERYRGVGGRIDPARPFMVVLQHPVTTEYGDGLAQINATIEAVDWVGRRGMQVVWLWPNADAGSDDVAKGLRVFRERRDPAYLVLIRNFAVEDYARLLNNAACIVGNSSSGLREGAFLGTPCVNIGSRQRHRDRAQNVIDVSHDADAIHDAIERQISNGRYGRSEMFGDGCAGQRIAEILATTPLRLEKTLNYLT